MAHLNGIQRTMAVRPTGWLINLEKKLQLELVSVLNQEEELWSIKSRPNWMIQGDRKHSLLSNIHSYHKETQQNSQFKRCLRRLDK